MTVQQHLTGVLQAAGINADRRTKDLPFVRVDFAGGSDIDESLTRGSGVVFVCVDWDEDPQPLAAQVWRILKAEADYIPRTCANSAGNPTEADPPWQTMAITFDTTVRWWDE